ncbi:hypothetical protein U1Q18_025675 [Sarracenia purpurea var. burkii]
MPKSSDPTIYAEGVGGDNEASGPPLSGTPPLNQVDSVTSGKESDIAGNKITDVVLGIEEEQGSVTIIRGDDHPADLSARAPGQCIALEKVSTRPPPSPAALGSLLSQAVEGSGKLDSDSV